MGYYSNEKADAGKVVRVGPNTKGTGRPGVPVAVALMGKDKVVPAVSDPEKSKPSGSARGQKGIKDVGSKRVGAANFTSTKPSYGR